MNSTHLTAGVGGALGLEQLTTLLTGWNGLTPERASAASWVLLAAGAGLYALASWFISWKWPSLPPLPVREAREEGRI